MPSRLSFVSFFVFLGNSQASLDILIISLGAEASPPSPPSTASGDETSPTPATPGRAPNNLVLQNVAKFQRLLGPSLRADTPGIRQRLLRLIQRLAALYGPGRPPKEFQDAKFWDNFQVKCVHAAISCGILNFFVLRVRYWFDAKKSCLTGMRHGKPQPKGCPFMCFCCRCASLRITLLFLDSSLSRLCG